MAGVLLLLLCFGVTLLGISCAKIGGYNTAPNTQYHIQTDEGPERYFRYQTISGQYRKEKRLQDGTVVGTYGWVDSNGFLRLRDYIADNKGYRIVRTKMVNVGVDTPIATAVSAAKKVPSQGGVGVKNAKIYQPLKPEISSTPNSITSYPSPTKSPISLSDYLKQNQHSLSYHTTPSPISSNSYIPGQPEVFITPNSYYPPSSINDPSYSSSVHPATTSTPYYESSTPIQPQTFRPYFNHNSLQNYYSPEANRRMFDNVGAQRFETSASNDYPLYDGVSMTHNGFRYYLPRHYHEEETLPNEKRAGSFGYIDPFGIRRVIYYNASPGSGFVHRKNNRYVGFDATPYDPRY